MKKFSETCIFCIDVSGEGVYSFPRHERKHATLPAPCRCQIGKTVYTATAQPWTGCKDFPAPGPYFWELVAVKGPKQAKSLFPDFRGNYAPGQFTLYSSPNGRGGVGLPKIVNVTFFTGPQA